MKSAAAADEVRTGDVGDRVGDRRADEAMIDDGAGNPESAVAMAEGRAPCRSGAFTVLSALAQLHCCGNESARRAD